MTEVVTDVFTPTEAKPILLTQPCVDKLRELISEEGADYKGGLRVAVAGSGCAGFSYQFMLEEVANEDDVIMDYDGVKIFVDSMSIMYLTGATLNFKDDLSGASFVISNPNATTTCGCGSSFSA